MDFDKEYRSGAGRELFNETVKAIEFLRKLPDDKKAALYFGNERFENIDGVYLGPRIVNGVEQEHRRKQAHVTRGVVYQRDSLDLCLEDLEVSLGSLELDRSSGKGVRLFGKVEDSDKATWTTLTTLCHEAWLARKLAEEARENGA